MKQKSVRILALTLVIVFLMFGCAQQSGTTTAAATEAAATTTTATAATTTTAVAAEMTSAVAEPVPATNYSSRVTISYNINNANLLVDNPLYDYFSEKFQVDMDFKEMAFGSHLEMTRVWAASGDITDVLWVDVNENNFSDWCQWVDSGLFSPIPKDLSKWPFLKAMLEDGILATNIFTRKGELYTIPCMRDTILYDNTLCINFAYRADWAQQLGLWHEDDIYTWREFMDLVKACIEQDPGGNGPGKTFGMSAPQSYFPEIFGIYQTNTTPWGFEEPNFIARDGKYVWYPTTDEYLTGLKIAKGIYDEGLIWPDNVVDSGSVMYSDLFYAGQMVAAASHTTISSVYSGRNRMKTALPDVDREMAWRIAKISSPQDDNFFTQRQMYPYWSINNLSARITDEQRDRFFDIWNWLLSPEGMDFRLYGLEGVDFNRNGDKVEILWPKNDLGNYVDPYAGMRGFYGRSRLAEVSLAYTNETIPQADREHGFKQWTWDWEHAHIQKADVSMLFSSSPNKDRLGLFTAEVKAKAIELLINSTVDTIDADMKVWTDSMMPRVQLVLDEINALPFIPNTYEELVAYMATR